MNVPSVQREWTAPTRSTLRVECQSRRFASKAEIPSTLLRYLQQGSPMLVIVKHKQSQVMEAIMAFWKKKEVDFAEMDAAIGQQPGLSAAR